MKARWLLAGETEHGIAEKAPVSLSLRGKGLTQQGIKLRAIWGKTVRGYSP